MFSHQCTRQLSASPPPVFSYPSYSHLDTYGQTSIYNSVSGSYSNMPFPGEYGELVPSILPVAAPPNAPVKRVHTYTDEEIMSPFSMSYATMAGIDLCPTSQPLSESSLPVHYPCWIDFYDKDPASEANYFLQISSLLQAFPDHHSSPSTSPGISTINDPLTPESGPCSPHSSSPFIWLIDARLTILDTTICYFRLSPLPVWVPLLLQVGYWMHLYFGLFLEIWLFDWIDDVTNIDAYFTGVMCIHGFCIYLETIRSGFFLYFLFCKWQMSIWWSWLGCYYTRAAAVLTTVTLMWPHRWLPKVVSCLFRFSVLKTKVLSRRDSFA